MIDEHIYNNSGNDGDWGDGGGHTEEKAERCDGNGEGLGTETVGIFEFGVFQELDVW